MSGHTKEPWAVHLTRALIVPIEHLNRPIGGHVDSKIDFETYAQEICALHWPDRHRNEDEVKANARRIVACVNACSGYETEHLESLVMVGDTVLNRIKENVKELNLADKKRDELLINLKKLVDLQRPITGNPSYQELIEYWQHEEMEGRVIAGDMINAINAIINCEATS